MDIKQVVEERIKSLHRVLNGISDSAYNHISAEIEEALYKWVMRAYEMGLSDVIGADSQGETKTANLDFGQALAAMREGKRVRRAGWIVFASIESGRLQKSDGNEEFGSNSLLATDWEIVTD
jgi:hypothetical protein